MYWQYTPYVWIYAVAATLGCGMGAYAWKHRTIPGAIPFAVVQFSSALWSIANALESSRTDLPSILFFSNVAFVGIGPLGPATLGIALQYTGRNQWFSRRKLVLLSFIPVMTVLLSWTNSFHGLVRHDVVLKTAGRLTVLSSTPGVWYWIHTAYAYILAGAALWVLVAALRHCPRPHRRQLFVLIAALLIIFGGNIARHAGLIPLPSHISSTFFVPAGVAFMLGLFRYRLFDIAPVARSIIFENLRDSVIVLDAKNRIVDMNPSARKLFGPRTHQAVGQSAKVLFGSRPDLVDLYRDVTDKRDEIVIERGEKQYYFDLGISPMRDRRGRLTGRLVVLSDITRRKQVEEELRKAKLTAESATRAKSEFLAVMSHEIRTPMNAVLGIADLMLATETDPGRLDLVQTIHQSGESLLTIINDVLDFSKIESGKLELEHRPFDLRHCVEQALDLLSSKAAEKGLDLACIISDDTPAVIVGDVTRLKQILVNLVGNALKFTESGEVVVLVSSQVCRPQDPHCEIHIAVRDTGIGIPHDRLDRLFQSFSQVDTSTTRRYGGTGLGLAICKRLSELMGGKIWADSQGVPGKGSTFHFTVVAESVQEQNTVEQGTLPELSGKRLLVVEDNETNCRILSECAQTLGISASAVSTGAQALQLVSGGAQFEIAIIDMQLPGADCSALARELQRGCGNTLALISLTWIGRRGGEAEAKLFAAQLTKPVKRSQLYHVLNSALNSQPARAGLYSGKAKPDPKMAERLPLRILLAEDNAINQKVAQHTLGRLGYRADVAANGLEVLEAFSRQAYDVVLMDLHMPEMDGSEAAQLLRHRFPEDQQPAIVAVTADAMQGDRERCLQAGMDHYISKPLRIEDLIQVLSQCRTLAAPKEASTCAGLAQN
jgi:PAS domain S-box-containing protein